MGTKFDSEFIKQYCRSVGIRCNLDIFPWKYLGWTDDAFMAETLRFAHGGVVPKNHQRHLLGIVRDQEKVLIERHEFVTARKRALNTKRLRNLAPAGKQLELF